MRFGAKWMEARVLRSSVSILVNGSPTKDFKVSRDLRQSDPTVTLLVFNSYRMTYKDSEVDSDWGFIQRYSSKRESII